MLSNEAAAPVGPPQRKYAIVGSVNGVVASVVDTVRVCVVVWTPRFAVNTNVVGALTVTSRVPDCETGPIGSIVTESALVLHVSVTVLPTRTRGDELANETETGNGVYAETSATANVTGSLTIADANCSNVERTNATDGANVDPIHVPRSTVCPPMTTKSGEPLAYVVGSSYKARRDGSTGAAVNVCQVVTS